MALDTGYVMKNGKIARKVIGGALSGIVAGTPLSTVVAYFFAQLTPSMPTEIRAIIVGWLVTAIVIACTTVGAILTAPDSGDVPVPAPPST